MIMSVPAHIMRVRQPSAESGEFAVVLGPQDEIQVIRHQHEGKDSHREFVECFSQDAEEGFVISRLLEKRQACQGPIENVVNNAARILSRTPRHGGIVVQRGNKVKINRGASPFLPMAKWKKGFGPKLLDLWPKLMLFDASCYPGIS